MLAVGCTMPNPAFEDGVEVLDEDDDAAGSTSSGEDAASSEDAASGEDAASSEDAATSEDAPTSEGPASSESTQGTQGVSTEVGSSDDSDGETGLPCDGLTECFGECVNTLFHDSHCGECGWICEPEQACVDGICVFGVKRAFVTSQAHGGSFTGGLVGADAFCNDLADAAGLEGYFLAWLSTRGNWPAAAYLPGNAYVMPDGTVIADTLAQLLDGDLAAPLDVTEHGEPQFDGPPPACGDVFAPVWSNTSALGEAALGPSCMDWTSGDGLASGLVGSASATDAAWTDTGCAVPCNQELPIYCIEG